MAMPTPLFVVAAAAVLCSVVPAVTAARLANTPQRVCSADAGPVGYPSAARGHPDRPGSMWSNQGGFAMLVPDDGGNGNRVVSWGNMYGNAPTGTGYVSIYSTERGFAALKADGSIHAWSCKTNVPKGTGFVTVFSSRTEFAALKEDGSISTWGSEDCGESEDWTWMDEDGNSVVGRKEDYGLGFFAIYSTNNAFAALNRDGSIHCWNAPGSDSHCQNAPNGTGFITITSSASAFVALKEDGSIHAWGVIRHIDEEMDMSAADGAPTGTGFVALYSTGRAFAALHQDDTVQVWGYSHGFWSGTADPDKIPQGAGYALVASTSYNFAGLHRNGTLHKWQGFVDSGGPYEAIFTNSRAFCALATDGSIHSWGYGGGGAEYGAGNHGGSNPPSGTGFVAISATFGAFAALHQDGTIHTWGEYSYGGGQTNGTDNNGQDSSPATGPPRGGGFVVIHSNMQAFAAVHRDGSVHAWGSLESGGVLPRQHYLDRPVMFSPSYDGHSSAVCADGRAPATLVLPHTTPAEGTCAGDALAAVATQLAEVAAEDNQALAGLKVQAGLIISDTTKLKAQAAATTEPEGRCATAAILNDTTIIKSHAVTIVADTAAIKSHVATVLQDTAEIKSQGSAIGELKSQVMAIGNDTAELKAQNTGLQTVVVAVVQGNAELKADVASGMVATGKVATSVAGIESQVTDLQSQVAAVLKDNTELKSQIAALPPLLEACTAARRARFAAAEGHEAQEGSKSSKSNGTIAGVVVSFLAGVGLTVALVVFVMTRRSTRGTTDQQTQKAASGFNNPMYEQDGAAAADVTYETLPAEGSAANDAGYDSLEAQAATESAGADHYHDPDLYDQADEDEDEDGGYLAVEGELNNPNGDETFYEEIVDATMASTTDAEQYEPIDLARGSIGDYDSDDDEIDI